MKTAIKLLFATVSIALITACGGGSSGGSATVAPVASTSTFPLQTVLANSLRAESNSYTISGTTNGVAVTGSGTATRGGLSAGTFEGSSALQRSTTSTGSIVVNGQAIPSNSSGTSWYNSNYLPLGSTGGEDYIVVIGIAVIPSSVRVGDTAPVYTANRYTNSSKQGLRGTEIVSYVVEADTASTALFTFISTTKNTSNVTESVTSAQVRMTTLGTFTRIKETYVQGTTVLTLTY